MSDDQPLEKPTAFEDLPPHLQVLIMQGLLPRQLQEPFRRAFLAGEKFQDAMRSGDVERELEAGFDVTVATMDFMRACLEVGRWGDTGDLAFTQAEATSALLDMGRQVKANLKLGIENLLALAFMESDDPAMDPPRERARALLLERNLVTEHELETFPRASVEAIVWERYRAWEEATPLP
jgi:hypothetical protein